jgi:WD40 repeat protein
VKDDPTVTLSQAPAGPAAAVTLPVRDRDRYELLEEHARGGLGRVWRARDLQLGRVVAIKEILASDDTARARLVREALVTARLEHPSIVPVHEAGRWDSGEPFYVMKLVAGKTLAERVRAAKTFPERLALLPRVLAIVEAMAYAHAQDVIHRDLKPSNVILGDYGETIVIDWGLAKDLRAADEPAAGGVGSSSPELTVDGTVVGTPSYMAPEQARGDEVDARADVHALGCVLYFTLVGRAPYAGKDTTEVLAAVRAGTAAPLAEIEPDAPRDLATIVAKAMARDPAARYATARELAEDLGAFQTGRIVSAHAYSTAELVRRWIRRHRTLAIATAVFVLLAAGGAGAFLAREALLRRAAERARDVAERNELALLEEEGREELAAGRPFRAAVYLAEAWRRRPSSLALRWLASEAARPLAYLERPLVGHTKDVPYAAYSPDGTRVVTASSDGTVRVWDPASGDAIAVIPLPGVVDAATFSPDGATIATSSTNTIGLYRAADGAQLMTIAAPNVMRAWFEPDGAHLIAGGYDGELDLIDARSGEILARSHRHADRIEDLRFSPDGTRFAVASWDKQVSVWDTASFTPTLDLDDQDAEVSSVAWSADGAWLLTVESDVWVHVRRADTGASVYTLRLPEGARFSRAWFAPDGQTIVTASFDGGVRTWQAASGALLESFDAQTSGKLMNAAMRPDGKELVTTGAGGRVMVWRLDRGRAFLPLARRLDERQYVYPSELAAGGALAITGDDDGDLDTYDARTGARLHAAKVPGFLYSIAPSADGAHVAGSGSTVPIGLWDAVSGGKIADLGGAARRDYNIAASADGTEVAAASWDGDVRVYDLASGEPRADLHVDARRLTAVTWRPDGRELAVTTEDGRLILVGRDGTIARTIAAHPNWIEDVSYSADGARVITAGRQDHAARVWDARTGALLLTLAGHKDNLERASFSPDGTVIATSALDHTARLWDATTGELLRTIGGASYTAVFDPTGTRLLTTGYHGYAVMWDLALDPRGPDELAAWIAARSPWRLVGGRLRTAGE